MISKDIACIKTFSGYFPVALISGQFYWFWRSCRVIKVDLAMAGFLGTVTVSRLAFSFSVINAIRLSCQIISLHIWCNTEASGGVVPVLVLFVHACCLVYQCTYRSDSIKVVLPLVSVGPSSHIIRTVRTDPYRFCTQSTHSYCIFISLHSYFTYIFTIRR